MLEIYNHNNIILYFTLYSFLGWLAETIYCFIIDKNFTYRGFLYGPVCPIYGTGALIVIFSLSYFENNIFLVFIMGMLLTSILEYITSFVLEKAFHMKWWDYSTYKFNLNGRICLLNSTLFGLLSVVLLEVINPKVIELINIIPSYLQLKLSNGIFIIFVIDGTLTIIHLLNLKEKLKSLKDVRLELEKLGVSIKSYANEELIKIQNEVKSAEAKKNMLKLKDNLNDSYKYKRLLQTFSHSKHKFDNKGLQDLKESLKK